MTSTRLVGVVIPAYNAAATLGATIRSAQAQRHAALEIVIVDDGSTDDTFAIASAHAALDDRIRVLQQRNAGLAAARNAGWRHARADVIAFLDADDLWAPSKIERQLDALESAGSQVGLVYCGSVRIDDESSVVSHFTLASCTGDVLTQLFTGNFIGNGSTALITRAALIYADGFDPRLRAVGAQGCEDYLLQCRIAERFHFAVVEEFLVGYRYHAGSMSSRRPQMLQSWMLVFEEMIARHPEHVSALRSGLRNYATWLMYDALAQREFAQISALVKLVLRFPPSAALAIPLIDVPRALVSLLRSRAQSVLRGTSRSSSRAPAGMFERAPQDRGKFI